MGPRHITTSAAGIREDRAAADAAGDRLSSLPASPPSS
jgi:hypothetical protein